MGNIVKPVFQAVATGSGLSKMYGEVKGLAKAMPGLTQAATILGGAFGSVGASFGRMATLLLQGGIWGAAAEGARLLIDRLGLFKDRSEEAKKRLEELKAASERYHEAILNGTEKALAKIDAETKRRNAQLDITNRMIKAELELQRARAVASGDVGKAESIGREIERRGNEATMEKAVANSNAAGTRSREADAGLEVARKAWQEAQRELTKAKKALAAASVPIKTTQIMQSSAGAFAMTNTVHRDTTNEQAAVNAARMDQAGELRDERQKDITDERFNARFTKLLTSGKIKRDANGNWKIDGRASNLDKAVLDRLNAQEKVKRAEAEAAKERQRLEKMEGYLKTISETIKTATEI